MTTIPRTAVTSSQITSIGHDPATNQLDIEFKSFRKPKPGQEPPAPSVYRYQNFSADQFAAFMAAESKGKHFGEYIKKLPGSHPFRKLSTEEAAQ